MEHLVKASYTIQYSLRRCDQIIRLKNEMILRFCFWITVDVLLGFMASEVVKTEIESSEEKLAEIALLGAERVVYYLKKLIRWLMGAPAGLKLNSVLSLCLGRFFLYHIELWVTFQRIFTPHVSHFLTHYCLEILSKMGFCMQLAVLQDAFNLITFHIHCFYAYARRLFISQSRGLMSLWRLFRGKKYNPLRDRVDSSSNSVDQLFLGTLAFTILLFLFPTTIMYFAVFKVLEFVLTVINATIETISKFLSHLALPPEEKNPIIWL